ncbi:SO_0444 family Cu/Zn efflux transporter [Acidihalobacter ferrooxydans]|uniref:Permease n=1 Tax=Acidihalobacter ferrooxydans TaxID=1765967 RepID=A0A1P8UEY6_9GAMM|nr:SO_0444 family Cu/Zn efflux transporter [Acidihalobacter ferrooxydans]APZ42417.1 hypothetical protein BW247_04370 [Acidihalobacter ferrooxydans]
MNLVDAIWPTLAHWLANTWGLFLEAAPWVILGLICAGLIKAWISQDRMARWLGGQGAWPVTKAALIGAPLPLCSCSVIPVALGLHRAGASRGATLSFLIATPETGVDSVATSFALLGPFMTVVRPLSAIMSAIVTGLLGSLAGPATHSPAKGTRQADRKDCDSAAYSTGAPASAVADAPDVCGATACGCESAVPGQDADASVWRRSAAGLRYAVTDLLDEFSLWMALGLALAGLTMTVVSPTALGAYGSGWPALLLMLLVGVPFYVCATESTPIATAMLLAGVSPGAALVFLLAGPATNLGTVGALRKVFGWRFVVVYLGGISACAIGFGWLTNALVQALHIDIGAQIQASAELLPIWVKLGCAVALAALALRPLRRRLPGLAPARTAA